MSLNSLLLASCDRIIAACDRISEKTKDLRDRRDPEYQKVLKELESGHWSEVLRREEQAQAEYDAKKAMDSQYPRKLEAELGRKWRVM